MNAVINTPVATATYSAFCLGLRLSNLAHALGQTHCLRRRSHDRAAVRMLPDQDGPFTLLAQFTCAEFTDRIDSPALGDIISPMLLRPGQ